MNILEPKLLILASAGSGKTYQLSNRIIGLIAQGAEPERIVSLTFTRKAAAEFADSMLTKLAKAAADPNAARALEEQLQLEGVDFGAVLERVSRSLHRITLGTMDSFFARIVRAFQYELGITGGRFELIEGPRQELAADAILEQLLGEVFARDDGHQFPHAFRRASMGRQKQGVAHTLREYIRQWHLRLRRSPGLRWGPEELLQGRPEDWEAGKHALCQQVENGLDAVEFTRKGQRETIEKCLEQFRAHTIASGSLGKGPALVGNILEAAATQDGTTLTLRHYKDFQLEGPTALALRELATLAARCELDAAVLRSRAIHEVMLVYDRQCDVTLRSRGQLGFDDIKLMMERWVHSEEARLQREAIDFRLDSRTDHWLLDEFQDTSRAEWNGLAPLIEEVASDDGFRTLFVVGDRKQAIYGWRGGDVSLFDQIITRYSPELTIEPLDVSWRSCPEVLSLVNRVCGNTPELARLFGDAGRQWDCPQHLPAPPLQDPALSGHALVEVVDGWDEKYERLDQLLRQLGVGERELTCGILLRGNEQAGKLATELRNRGFDVILEGQREPGRDHPVGVAISSLLEWLAKPDDRLAQGVLAMSPLWPALQARHGEEQDQIWSGLHAAISAEGYQPVIRRLAGACEVEWSEFSRRRIEDLLQALGDIDRRGAVSSREVAETIASLKIAQSPGMAAVQVMTIHKSKGLGFDVVILPEIPKDSIPSAQHFQVAEGPDWLCETPPAWARRFHPTLGALEEQWATKQRQEALCVLYVALTRAKRGLYVFLDPPPKKQAPDHVSLAHWMREVTGHQADAEGPCVEEGSIDWVRDLPTLDSSGREKEVEAPLRLPASDHATPSALSPSQQSRHREHHAAGMEFGRQVHELFEAVGWIDEEALKLPEDEAGVAVRRLLENPDTAALFQREGRSIRLLREQAADALVDGRWVSGIVDRLHLHLDAAGAVSHIDIIDFKTDAAEDPEALRQAYQGQLHAYRDCLTRLHPAAETRCLLLSTHLAQVIEC